MRLTVAAYGWQQAEWDSYYPDDLPAEWRLDYYANEYDAVVVPAEAWHDCDVTVLEEWLEEAPQGFRFFWELADEAQAEPLIALYRQQSALPSAGGWLLLGSAPSLPQGVPTTHCQERGDCRGEELTTLRVEEGTQLRHLRERIDRLAAEGVGEVLLVVPPTAGAEEQLRSLHTLSQLYAG